MREGGGGGIYLVYLSGGCESEIHLGEGLAC